MNKLVRPLKDGCALNTLTRVSVSARVLIVIHQKILLSVNLDALELGNKALWPFGGGVLIKTSTGKKELITELDACDFEGTENDLRFKLPKQNLAKLQRWLKSGPLKKGTAKRELLEEAEEHDIPLALAKKISFSETPTRTVEETRLDWSYLSRPVRQVPTFCIDHIYKARVPAQVSTKLYSIAMDPKTHIQLVSANEIRSGQSQAGYDIPAMCKHLL